MELRAGGDVRVRFGMGSCWDWVDVGIANDVEAG